MCRPNRVMCFRCGKWFAKALPRQPERVKQCAKCGDFTCPHCSACMCSLTKAEQRIVMAMMHTYERHLHDIYGEEEYDFEQHKAVEASLF